MASLSAFSGRVEALRADRLTREGQLASFKFLIVLRPFTFEGRRLETGTRFKTRGASLQKIAQLVENRFLEAPVMHLKHEAARRFSFQGRAFVPGDSFPIDGLRPEKVAQLLEQRFIQPSVTTE